MTEYHWEAPRWGQGHYYQDLVECVKDARDYSEKNQTETVVKEISPKCELLAVFESGHAVSLDLLPK